MTTTKNEKNERFAAWCERIAALPPYDFAALRREVMTEFPSFSVDGRGVEHDSDQGYVYANQSGIECLTGQLVPRAWMPDEKEEDVLFISEEEADTINEVLWWRQWSPRSNPSNIGEDPDKWAIAVKHGFAQEGERERLIDEMKQSRHY